MNHMEKILVIDDNPAFLEQAEEILSNHYEISLATSGKQAIQFLERGGKADLILLDILMPEMDGYQTLENIHKIQECQEIPVIFLTSLNDTKSELQGLSIGAADYITKPFESDILLARVQLRIKNAILFDEKKLSALTFPLTDSERRVAKLIAHAYSNDQIAQELHYSLNTVKKMVSRILEKLEIKTRKDIKNFIK